MRRNKIKKIMPKCVVISVSMLLLLTVLSIFMPMASADPSIIIYDYTLSPEVFMSGDGGTLKLTIKNAETTNTISRTTTGSTTTTVYTDTVGATINNIWVVAATDSYGKKVKATLNYEDIGYLAPLASFDVTFKIVAEAGISEGLYFPIVRIDVESYQDVSFPIPVTVSNSSVDLISTKVPSKISMSGSTDITLTAVNNRESSVDGVCIAPKNVDDVEFIPDSIFVGTMSSGASEAISFSIKPSAAGVKNISFDVSYKNGDNLHDQTLNLSLEVVETLDVAPVFTGVPPTIKKGGSTRITLEIYNAKTEAISGVIITPVTEASVVPSQYFIGAMDPDDVFSASFTLYTDDLESGEYTIGFKVSFKQGDDYYETPTVSSTFSVASGSGSDAQSSADTSQELSGLFGRGLGGLPTYLLIISIIVAAVVAFLVLRWKKRRNA